MNPRVSIKWFVATLLAFLLAASASSHAGPIATLEITLNPTTNNMDPFGIVGVPSTMSATITFDVADDMNPDPNIIELADGMYLFNFDAGAVPGPEDIWSNLSSTNNNAAFSFDIAASTTGLLALDFFTNPDGNSFSLFNSIWSFFDRSKNNAFLQGGYGAFTLTTTAVPVPEPTTLVLFIAGLAGLAAAWRRQRTAT